jgi:hypothetical protein
LYYKKNRDYILKQHLLNKDTMKEYMVEWREKNCDYIIEYRKNYYNLNKEKISAQRKHIRLNKKLQNQQQDSNT